MFHLKEATESGDSNQIISSLISLRKASRQKKIDATTFKLIVNLIKIPNDKIINYALSILANCCLITDYQNLFKELGGIPHLLLVIRTLESDSIICRACRLIGNLAANKEVANNLCENDAGSNLLNLLENIENPSSDTLLMIHRALNKLWINAECKHKMLPTDLWLKFKNSLNSDDDEVVKSSLKIITNYSKWKCKNSHFQVSKDVLLKVVELSKKKEINHLAILCLSSLICYQTFWKIYFYIEDSNMAETFIEYIQRVNAVDKVILEGFYYLCLESVVRDKVRTSGLLHKLINIYSSKNANFLLEIFYLFQFDLTSMSMCSQNPKFITILIDNILHRGAITLLYTLSRLNPPAKELVLDKNLDVIIKSQKCCGVLKNIVKHPEFLKTILLSGRVWEIEKAGCSMEDVGCFDHSEGLIVHLLNSGEKKYKENIALAIPFLIKPRNFELLYKLLARNQVISIILHLLQEDPTEEKILATIIRLIHIFNQNYKESENFFQDMGESSGWISLDNESMGVDDSNIEKLENVSNKTSESEMVTFQVDNGQCVVMDKNLICRKSPVFDSMLNGSFLEATKKVVRLRCCSEEALTVLRKLLIDSTVLPKMKTSIYLELLSLTDRFLIDYLHNILAENLEIDKESCPLVYDWCRKAGYIKNSIKIRQKTYQFIFSSTDNLLTVMKNESCRSSLTNDISNYLNKCLIDLL